MNWIWTVRRWPRAADAARAGFAAASALLLTPIVLAQSSAPQQVEVTGSAQVDERREGNAAKLIVSREDIARYGDTALPDLLRRVPGVTTRGNEVRLRGLGSGYTQILINGEPVPPGFALDSISPALIERIEVQRSASVDQSTQAIAGSINIVLRQTVRSAQRELKLSSSSESGRPTLALDGTWAERGPALQWSLGAGLRHEETPRPQLLQQTSRAASGALQTLRDIDDQVLTRGDSIQLAPRLQTSWGEHDTLAIETLLRYQVLRISDRNQRIAIFGPPPAAARDDLQLDLRNTLTRSRLSWTHKFSADTNLEVKAGLNQFRRVQRANFDVFDGAERLTLHRTVNGLANDLASTLTGKLRAAYGVEHALAVGWDLESSKRAEDRIQRETSPTGLRTANLDEVYDARVRRIAFFAQDEWEFMPRASLYLGLRWEGLHTHSAGNVLDGIKQRTGVASPIANLLWKLPGNQRLRASLARTYKAPNTRDLIARRFTANDNTATTPDFQGNPALRPELAWSVDIGYERYFGEVGMASVNVYARRIENVIQRELAQINGAWVSRPVNLGLAHVQGIELEGKLHLRKWQAAAPALELRGNVAVNSSRVDAVPGPRNRLDQQTPLSANLSLDHQPDASALSWGTSLAWQGGGPSRQSAIQSTSAGVRRTLDVYALWKQDARLQWRLSLNNLLHPDRADVQEVVDAQGSLVQRTLAPGALVLRLVVELKL